MSGQRVALLVGVSEYGEGYDALPGTVTDLERMQRVLKNPDMGGFDVETLLNPNPQPLREAIERFFGGRKKEDVLLFYFSGHGALDTATGSQLYLSTRQTRKEAKQLFEPSAVEVEWLHRRLITSQSQQKIVILDCCFSGAVANLLNKGDDPVNLRQLEAQGTVLLASCSAFEVSYQTKGAAAEVDIAQSLYTRYLVEGIETGAARQGKHEWIFTQDLHEYAKRRFQTELAAATEPQIIVFEKEGYRIPIARAPKGDPKVEYRQIVAELLQENDGDINELERHYLLEIERKELELSLGDAQQILIEQQKPYEIRKQKQTEYTRTFETALKQGYPISVRARKILKRTQLRLSLRDEDVAQLESRLTPAENPLDVQSEPQPAQPETTQQPVSLAEMEQIASEVIPKRSPTSAIPQRYQKLASLLAAAEQGESGKWQEADRETLRVMCEVAQRETAGWLRVEDMNNFPCEDLQIINELWVTHSDGKFGFSVQKQIWQDVGSPTVYNDAWEEFGDRVGWRVNGRWIDYPDNVTFDTSAPGGHLPVGGVGGLWWGVGRVLGFLGLLSRPDL